MSDVLTVRPGAVDGEVQVPGSKSVTHRAFLLAAQSATPCTVLAPLRSADTNATLSVLMGLGARFAPNDRAVEFSPAPLLPPKAALDCRNSGTTLRLVSGLAARMAVPVLLTGDDSLTSRPNGPLLQALAGLGVQVASRDGRAPLTIRGPMTPGRAELPAGVSSQYGSSLLLSLPMLAGSSTLHMAAPVASRPYLDVSLDVAAAFGLGMEVSDDDGFTANIPGGQVPRAVRFTVEADWSTAAFPLVAAAVTGGKVTCRGVRPGSRQGDKRILDVLRQFGATVEAGDDAATVQGGQLESPGDVDVSATPDMFPILTILAACSKGTTTFTGGESLRHKESDRIAAMAQGLAQMGATVRELPAGLEVTGGPLRGATIDARRDHRIHMAFAVAGLVADGETTVNGAAEAAVSYPGFAADLDRLRGVTA